MFLVHMVATSLKDKRHIMFLFLTGSQQAESGSSRTNDNTPNKCSKAKSFSSDVQVLEALY